MIGLRAGLKAGPIGGARAGIGTDELAPQGSNTTQTIALADNSTSGAVITGGDAFAITCTYTNTGSNTATSVSVAITLDANATYVSSSGTGWSFSGPTANVLTATRATAAAGVAPTITVNLTSPSSATTLTTTAQATASNASTANSNTDSITVNLVSKDATAGKYLPASSTELANFVARKGLSVSAATSLYLMQEASGNLTDSISALTLTATGAPSYQQTKTGWSRKFITSVDAGTVKFSSTGMANPASSSFLMIGLAYFPSAPATTRNIYSLGSSAANGISLTSTQKIQEKSSANTVNSTGNYCDGAVRFYVHQYDHTNSLSISYTDSEKLSATFVAASGASFNIFSTGTSGAEGWGYCLVFTGAAAEISAATIKALLQAMGETVTWT